MSKTPSYAGRGSRRPLQIATAAFILALMLGTGLLMLPVMSVNGHHTNLLPALFTATSAICVTGLQVIDPEHWSVTGYAVLMVLIQAGGLGVMTLATLIGSMISRRFDTRIGLSIVSEHQGEGLGKMRALVLRLARTTLLIEGTATVILTLRFWLGYGESLPRALWRGAFLAVSAFNNAGFAFTTANMMDYQRDAIVLGTIGVAIILGGLGYPVLIEFARLIRIHRAHDVHAGRLLSIHSILTVAGTIVLLVGGAVMFLLLEWANPGTFGPMPVWEKILNSSFHSTTLRTAGFASIDISQQHTQSWFVSDVLMFIGGGSAGTASGIKVTTFALVGLILFSQIRGTRTVHVLGRSISDQLQRQAVTVALLAVGMVFAGSLALSIMTPYSLDQILYEVTSAFSTVGVTTGITPKLPADSQVVIILLMVIGRLGTVTVAGALALRNTPKLYDYPEERVLVG